MLQMPGEEPLALQHCELARHVAVLFIGMHARHSDAPPPAGGAHCGQEGMHSSRDEHGSPHDALLVQMPEPQ